MKKSTFAGLITAATIAAVGVAALGTAGAYERKGGGDGHQGPRFNFEMLDANSDGKITPEEMAEHRAAEFDARDADDDGFLSKEELAAAIVERMKQNMDQRIDRMLERRDADDDGKISLAELSGDKNGARMFERLDKDGDGAISAEEMENGRKGFGRGGHGHDNKGQGKRWQQPSE